MRARTPAARALEFFRRFLTHVQGPLAGQPLVLARWQRDRIIRPLFDTLQPGGRRRFRTCFVTCPRKQGKSTLASALGLFLLYCDGEPGAEIVSAASDRAQAAIVFDAARRMVEASSALRDMTLVYRRELFVPSTGSRFRVVSSDAPRQHGLNLSGAIIDELHAHKDRRLFDALTTATGARPQPLTFIISTATDDPHSIMAEMYDYATKVRDGVVPDDSFLPIVFSAGPEDDPWSEDTWYLCNPALNDFRDLAEFRIAAQQAREIPGRQASFRTLYLNQMFAGGESRWLALASWDACTGSAEAQGGDFEQGGAISVSPRRAFIGLDLSTTIDLSALIIVLPTEDGYEIKAEFWCPADHIAERSRRDRVPYEVWVKQGHLTATPGNTVDYTVIESRLHALMTAYDVVEIAVDPWNARDLVTRLQRDGLPAVEVPQTMSNLTSASKALETLVLSRKLQHDGHPVLRWNVSNAVADVDGNGNLKPSKKRSVERIDGVSALVTALARALVDPATTSVYDTRPPIFVDL